MFFLLLYSFFWRMRFKYQKILKKYKLKKQQILTWLVHCPPPHFFIFLENLKLDYIKAGLLHQLLSHPDKQSSYRVSKKTWIARSWIYGSFFFGNFIFEKYVRKFWIYFLKIRWIENQKCRNILCQSHLKSLNTS